MIKNFKHKGLELYFIKDIKKLLDAKDLPKIERILDTLDAATLVKDMDIPGWNLHELKVAEKELGVRLYALIGKLLSDLKMAMP